MENYAFLLEIADEKNEGSKPADVLLPCRHSLSFPIKRIHVSSSSFFMSLSNRQSMRNSTRQSHINPVFLPSREVGAQLSISHSILNFEVAQSNLANVAHGKKRGCSHRVFVSLVFPFRMKHVAFFICPVQFCCVSESNAAAPNSTFLRNANCTHKTTTCWNG